MYVKYEPGANPACSTGAGGCSSAKVIGLLVFITFAMYWISEFLKNMIHVIISGVYGSWYFCSHNPPKNITRGAARRSLTYSFGSISLGSLVVAIINMLRQACSIARQQEANSGNFAAEIALCVLQCLIGILDWAVQFINVSAKFAQDAIIGKFQTAHETPHRDTLSAISHYTERPMSPLPRPLGRKYLIYTKVCSADKNHNSLIKDRGIDALVNEVRLYPTSSLVGCALINVATVVFNWSRPDSGRYCHRLPVRPFGLPVPDLHLARVQQQRRVHARCRCVRVLDWPTNRQYLYNPA